MRQAEIGSVAGIILGQQRLRYQSDRSRQFVQSDPIGNQCGAGGLIEDSQSSGVFKGDHWAMPPQRFSGA